LLAQPFEDFLKLLLSCVCNKDIPEMYDKLLTEFTGQIILRLDHSNIRLMDNFNFLQCRLQKDVTS
jgi:hypothetical protein